MGFVEVLAKEVNRQPDSKMQKASQKFPGNQ